MKRGYTLIELLIGMSIMAIIFSIGFVSYRDFSRRQILVGVSKNIVSDLRLLQQKALSGEKPEGCTTLSGYQLNRISASVYNLEAVCEDTVLIRETDLTENDTTISVTANPIRFKVLGQGTNLESETTITLSNTAIARSLTVTVGIGGEIR